MCLVKSENNSTVAQDDSISEVNQINVSSNGFYFIRFIEHNVIKHVEILNYN